MAVAPRGSRQGAILVTGGTGFVGTAVLRALLDETRSGSRPEIRVLSRRALPSWMTEAGAVEVRADLVDPATLRGVCRQVSTVVHLATHIGGDSAECVAVNAEGTLALLDEARRAGTRRIVNVSTTSVYGCGVHRGITESALAPVPVSATSRTRLTAERAVRAMGGIVLRPNLIYGPGDVWFVPTLLRLLRRVPAWIEGGRARISVVPVEDLGRIVGALALMPWEPMAGAVFHVSHPQPVSVHTLTRTVCGQLGLPLPEHDLPATVHRALTRRAVPELTDHQFSLLAQDHWYSSERIWRKTGVTPAGSPVAGMARAAEWYRRRRDAPALIPVLAGSGHS
ncbi:NAD-dependent epimerase/dehydratase family protein [Actinophytocola sp.]|uniref:NAD-dependent epimerase/dehydratase family protein n=1 Tax=Actinophytocola sp. TaxID=1872138 RepID=UPI002D7EBB7F|nr:NAD-dependent epimerase/dehydratase family protein [Actinophytocola sp.]HET9139817.1 NAD-dependent epimerase/dehydratase family protein [Actinophytocola sp.]HEU5108604.1 NAD-dependent epimerase/dehydratase family protein [Micromonosporaceae bacterium]